MQSEGRTRATALAGVIALVVLAAVWSWWAVDEGGYFGVVLYPGLVILCAGLVLVSSGASWSARLSLSTPAIVALSALLGLAAWSALSALWSPSPDIAVADAQRIAGYAVAFGLGIWLCTLFRERVHLAMAPLALAGAVAGLVTVVTLLTGDDYGRYVDEGTLQFPIGYRNANAAFFLIALWPAVALAASRELDWRIRGIALGAASLCLALGMLSQSRGSMIAGAGALAVFVIASRDRARAVAWLLLAVAPALLVIPALADLYQAADSGGTAELRAAGRAAAGGAALAVLIGGAAAWLEGRRPPADATLARANRAVGVGAVALVLVGAIAFTVGTGDPVGWVDDRLDEFLTQSSPGAEGASSRFGVNAGSERDDLWRAALEAAGEEPVLGLGGGGYQYEYLLRRSEEGIESALDAHSVELEVLSELGIPGLALLLLALVGAAVAAWRARRIGPPAAALAACALTAGAYWLLHASLDWFWTYPAVTAPVFALLGSASAPTGATEGGEPRTAWRLLVAGGAAVLALSVVPPYLAERYVDAAYGGWRDDPAEAQDNLDRARTLNPFSIEPLLAEGGIARERGDRGQAIAAFEEVAEERPEEWASHYFLAALHRSSDPARARAELALALELNPHSETIEDLAERFRNDRR
jgi:O-Antigen ligase